MERLRPLAVTAFCAVTLFTWGNRIWLAWTDPDDTLAAKLVWTLPVTLFVAAAVVLLAVMVRGIDRTSTGFVRGVRVFAGATVAYWTFRLIDIVIDPQWSVGFKVVHAVLAVVSSVAAVAAWRSVHPVAGRPVPSDRVSAAA